MNTTRLRALIRRYGDIGVLLAVACLGARHLRMRRHGATRAIPALAVVALFLVLFHPTPKHATAKPTDALPTVKLPRQSPTPKQPFIHAKPDFARGTNTLPYWAHWGKYLVVVEEVRADGCDEGDCRQRVRILDDRGALAREIDGYWFSEVNTVELTGRAPAELHLSDWTGGAYSASTDLYFTQEGGLRNILIFEGNHLGVQEVKDLNGDGIPEIIAESPALEGFSGYTFHRCHPLIAVLDWKGEKYLDQTGRYPQQTLPLCRELRQDLREAIADRDASDWAVQDMAAAYYGNMLRIGRGDQARRWLLSRLPKYPKEWLLAYETELREVAATAGIPRRAYTSNAKVIDIQLVSHFRPKTEE